MRRFLPLVALIVAMDLIAAEEYSLTVSVSGLTPGQGNVFVSLFDSEDSFLREPLEGLDVPVGDSDSLDLTFEDLPAGNYAVSAIYDENANGELDTGLFRIPKEPVGTSNNPKARFGPPKWDAAKFELVEDMRIEISIRKPD